MNRSKTNNSIWYSVGLVVLLCVAFFAIATGTTLARYRAEEKVYLTFQVKPLAQTFLGTVTALSEEELAYMIENEIPGERFEAEKKPEWTEHGETLSLDLAIANGSSSTEYSEKDQKVSLRLIGTLGLWSGEGVSEICLEIPSETEGEITEIVAVATPIEEGTVLHNTHGAGWIYTFVSEEGEELSWILPGGKLSYIKLRVTMNGEQPSDISLLQPQIYAALIDD